MSVEVLIGKNPNQILEAQSYVSEKAKKEIEAGYAESPVHIVASVFIDEGRKELKEISERLIRSGVRINPGSNTSIFDQLPKTDRKPAGFAYAAVAFGVFMISIERLHKTGVFRPYAMADLFNYSVDRTFIPRWGAGGLGEIEIPRSNLKLLDELVSNDPSHAIILTKGMDLIPDELKRKINKIGLVPFATRTLIPSFTHNVRKLISENAVQGKR